MKQDYIIGLITQSHLSACKRTHILSGVMLNKILYLWKFLYALQNDEMRIFSYHL